MPSEFSRRDFLALTATAAATLSASHTMFAAPAPQPSRHGGPFRYCLNTSTIREQKLGIVAEVELAAKVGYDGIEPWIRELDDFR
ncbi:MAG: hypothetical protein B7Z51_00240 [Methyloversatilis sp. 12-65-5]|nr:MAG: hypothetical protein B7Z51_00240 [Methyloversatilis sp. 12-65-5]